MRLATTLLYDSLAVELGIRPPQHSMRHRLSRDYRLGLGALFRSIVQTVLLGAFSLTLACTGWYRVPVEAVPAPARTLRVHLRDGTSVIVRDAVVRADSIVGVVSGSMPPVPAALALAQVEHVEVAEMDRTRTAHAILNVAILAACVVGAFFLLAPITGIGYHEGT